MNPSSAAGPHVFVVRRRWWPRLLAWSLVSVLALGVVLGAIGAAAWQTVPELSQMVQGLRISIDGRAVEIGAIDPMHVWVGAIVVVALLALLLALVPLLLATVALVAVGAVGGGVALALLAAAGVAALLLSPLLAAGLLGWWLWRRRPAPAAARTTMAS